MQKRVGATASLLFIIFLISNCVLIFRSNSVNSEVANKEIKSPVKVHLNDGRTAVFRSGATFTESKIAGQGFIYSLTMELEEAVSQLDRSNVAAYEVFNSGVRPVSTFLSSAAATAAIAYGTAALAFIIFGSCPTVYAATDSSMVLESELFSNSISPIIEKRDVTDIYKKPDENGLLKLEIRNEALETHYLNHLELLEVTHEQRTDVIPDSDGRIYAVGNLQAPETANDSLGRDLQAILAKNDSLDYSSEITTGNSTESVQWDYIDLEFTKGDQGKSVLVLELRNSLFATVLLYDYLIASQGIRSLDWIGKELETVSGAVALADFYKSYMGLRIQQEIDGTYQTINRIPDTGPIASRKIAAAIKDIPGSTVKLRLKFLADSWRINSIKMATDVSMPEIKYLPINALVNAGDRPADNSLPLLEHPDKQYIVTTPGDRYTVHFETTPPPGNLQHSYLLAAQGYYIEWVREGWMQEENIENFELSENLIMQAQKKWRGVKEDFEQQFFESKIPVR